jgi:hypothetical protein
MMEPAHVNKTVSSLLMRRIVSFQRSAQTASCVINFASRSGSIYHPHNFVNRFLDFPRIAVHAKRHSDLYVIHRVLKKRHHRLGVQDQAFTNPAFGSVGQTDQLHACSTHEVVASSHEYRLSSVGIGTGAFHRQVSSFSSQDGNGLGAMKASRCAS